MTEANTGSSPAETYIGRFAPSPTGPLHFGSLVTCLASYLDARAHRGTWLLRIEDVDITRCKPEYADDIVATLTAFGFMWDGEIRVQSRQTMQYEAVLRHLIESHAVFACRCSRKEIADSAVDGVDGPVYPGTCRNQSIPFAGNAIRLRVPATRNCFDDRVQGKVCQELASEAGDFVLKRRDGLIAYQLAVVVDDAEQEVTHIVRGADLLDSTARQIYLQQVLDLPTPTYLHIPVVTNSDGQKLSKQTLAAAIAPADASRALCRALAFLGQAPHPATTNAPPAEILSNAITHWQPDAVPKQRSAPEPATFGDSQCTSKLIT
ncbi:MAG: tRNA glutamyl-Q(34) synthetase GluQRS [Betaproteobacteria bacterium]|nr:tRNA glutamyl-Q(34) synthetase GluQRS [Betaproteobacteria bacterium]